MRYTCEPEHEGCGMPQSSRSSASLAIKPIERFARNPAGELRQLRKAVIVVHGPLLQYSRWLRQSLRAAV
jgi:hypothetical protein